MVRALAKMTPERMNTMIEALPRILSNFLTNNCPTKPAKTDTVKRYIAAKEIQTQQHDYDKRKWYI